MSKSVTFKFGFGDSFATLENCNFFLRTLKIYLSGLMRLYKATLSLQPLEAGEFLPSEEALCRPVSPPYGTMRCPAAPTQRGEQDGTAVTSRNWPRLIQLIKPFIGLPPIPRGRDEQGQWVRSCSQSSFWVLQASGLICVCWVNIFIKAMHKNICFSLPLYSEQQQPGKPPENVIINSVSYHCFNCVIRFFSVYFLKLCLHFSLHAFCHMLDHLYFRAYRD